MLSTKYLKQALVGTIARVWVPLAYLVCSNGTISPEDFLQSLPKSLHGNPVWANYFGSLKDQAMSAG
jgi:hypothetical protein